jgi:crotonobetainyl-CoA:carnitine CoA-transferase CaiB-like acyl-CoA transferase
LGEREIFVETVVPGLDAPTRIVGAGFLFGHDGPAPPGPVRDLGEHSDAILAELGYGRAKISELREKGTV